MPKRVKRKVAPTSLLALRSTQPLVLLMLATWTWSWWPSRRLAQVVGKVASPPPHLTSSSSSSTTLLVDPAGILQHCFSPWRLLLFHTRV